MTFVNDFRCLLPPEAVAEITDSLVKSIKEFGVISPIAVLENTVVDGHRRLACMKMLGINNVAVSSLNGTPWSLYWQLNINRSWNLVEMALVCKNLPAAEMKKFLVSRSMKHSPHLEQCLFWIADHPNAWASVLDGSVSMAMLRDLSHLGTFMGEAFSLLASLTATSAERRMIAGLLRRILGKGLKLPFERIKELSVAEILSVLLELLEPRRTAVAKKFTEFYKQISWPKGVRLEVDPVFEEPGITLHMQVRRNQRNRIQEVANGLDQLFELVQEL